MSGTTNRRAKARLVGVTVAIVLAVIATTSVVGASGGSVAATVAEAAAAPAGERVKLSGKVESVEKSASGTSFVLAGTGGVGGRVTVRLSGPVPSTLGVGTEAMLNGTADGAGGVSEVSDLVVKCPSKYESADASANPETATPVAVP